METKATKTETEVKNLLQDDGKETKTLFKLHCTYISLASMLLYFVLYKIKTVEVELYFLEMGSSWK